MLLGGRQEINVNIGYTILKFDGHIAPKVAKIICRKLALTQLHRFSNKINHFSELSRAETERDMFGCIVYGF